MHLENYDISILFYITQQFLQLTHRLADALALFLYRSHKFRQRVLFFLAPLLNPSDVERSLVTSGNLINGIFVSHRHYGTSHFINR